METIETTAFPGLTVTVPVSTGGESTSDCTAGIPGLISNETEEGLHNFSNSYRKVHGYVAVAVCLFGVLSNSANIIVLTRKNMASSTNTLLLWLAVSDLLTMLSYLPFAIHFYIMEPGAPTRPLFSSPEFPLICFLLFHASFSIVCHTIAIWLTIALAIFRYIYICKPTKGAFYCSQQRARRVVIAVIVLTILICIPNYAVNTYDEFLDAKNITNGKTAVKTLSVGNISYIANVSQPKTVEIRKLYYFPTGRERTASEVMITQINYWIQAILIKMVPCGMLTALTLLLVHAMHKAYRKRLKLKSQGRKAESDKHGEHNRTTGMLLAVVVLFTLTELPQGILTLMNIFIKCFTQIVYYRLGDLLDIMALTNNSVNFVLYCTMSTQFRNTFCEIFCCTFKNKPKWMKLRLVNGNNTRNAIEVNQKRSKANKNKRQIETNKSNGEKIPIMKEKPLELSTNETKPPKGQNELNKDEPQVSSKSSHDIQLNSGNDVTHSFSPDQTFV